MLERSTRKNCERHSLDVCQRLVGDCLAGSRPWNRCMDRSAVSESIESYRGLLVRADARNSATAAPTSGHVRQHPAGVLGRTVADQPESSNEPTGSISINHGLWTSATSTSGRAIPHNGGFLPATSNHAEPARHTNHARGPKSAVQEGLISMSSFRRPAGTKARTLVLESLEPLRRLPERRGCPLPDAAFSAEEAALVRPAPPSSSSTASNGSTRTTAELLKPDDGPGAVAQLQDLERAIRGLHEPRASDTRFRVDAELPAPVEAFGRGAGTFNRLVERP